MNNDYIKDIIISAFEDVTLDDGIGLWEAQAIDDYESKENQKITRQRDEKMNWQLIPAEDIFYCDSSLTFFDEKGTRFHLPAFILAELNGKENIGCFHHLTTYVNPKNSKFNILNSKQKHAVSLFLEWCSIQTDYEYEIDLISKVLENYWYKI